MAAREDMDSLHALPLVILPLLTPGLHRARLIKNSRLDGVVEMFSGSASGSGQIAPDDLQKIFSDQGEELQADMEVLCAAGALHSFDVYSLRIELRRLDIPIEDHAGLRLSEEKNRQLTVYMKDFTRPLLQQIYGEETTDIDDMQGLVSLFQSPDRDQVVLRIMKIANEMGIRPSEVPLFLEEYGDVFLSLAYYRDCLDRLQPRMRRLSNEIKDLLSLNDVTRDRAVAENCARLEAKLSGITAALAQRFESFERNSERLWDHINAEAFQRVKELITSHYTTVGGILCGLEVKLDAWESKFPHGRGGAVAKTAFLTSEMRHGMEKIENLQRNAPRIADLPVVVAAE
ncbi:MAG: hypothetical protein QF578_04115 [Alphaproteobacteria bacterium]|nr:hypothetical protein [Alphaproteobacteria bacterium]MDP6814131.1 hypothetical protein [Alphaproteobacteria bacterium]